MERPGVQSGDEQGAGPGWKVGRRQLRTHRHPDLDHQGAARGGQWGGTGGGSGWEVGTREQHGEDGGKQPSLPRWLSTHSPGWKVGTNRERPGGGKWGRTGSAPGAGSGGAQRLSAHSWAQRLRARAQCLRARAQHSPTRRTHPHNNAHRRARPWLQVGHNPCTTRKDQTSTWGYFNDPRHSVRLVDHTSTRAHAIITGAHAQGALSKSRIPDPSKTQ